MEIHIFFHNIRLEEYERVNKKRRMRADHSEESSFRMDNNESDAMGWSHGKKQRCVLLNSLPWRPASSEKLLTS